MRLYNERIVAKLIQDVTFFPIYIQLQSFLIVVSNIGYSKNNGCRAGNGFISSLQTKFQGKYSLVSQQIMYKTGRIHRDRFDASLKKILFQNV